MTVPWTPYCLVCKVQCGNASSNPYFVVWDAEYPRPDPDEDYIRSLPSPA